MYSPEEEVELTTDTPLFGMNPRINQILSILSRGISNFKKVDGELSYRRDFDAESVKQLILSKLERGCLGPSKVFSLDMILLIS